MSSKVQALHGDIDFSANSEDARLAAIGSVVQQASELQFKPLSTIQANKEALSMLRWCFAMLNDQSNDINDKRALNIWIEVLPPAYVEGIRDMDAGALIILAHWCVMLKQAEHYWYLKNSAAQVLSSIYHVLDNDWQEAIAWPLQVVFT